MLAATGPSGAVGDRWQCTTDSKEVRVQRMLGVRKVTRPFTRATAWSYSVGGSAVTGSGAVDEEGWCVPGTDFGGVYTASVKNMSWEASTLGDWEVSGSAAVAVVADVTTVASSREIGESDMARNEMGDGLDRMRLMMEEKMGEG